MTQDQLNTINSLPGSRREYAVGLDELCQLGASVCVTSRQGKIAAMDLFNVGAVTYTRCRGGVWRVRAVHQTKGQS